MVAPATPAMPASRAAVNMNESNRFMVNFPFTKGGETRRNFGRWGSIRGGSALPGNGMAMTRARPYEVRLPAADSNGGSRKNSNSLRRGREPLMALAVDRLKVFCG